MSHGTKMKNLLAASTILVSVLAGSASAEEPLSFEGMLPPGTAVEVIDQTSTRQGLEARMLKIDAQSHIIQVLDPKLSGGAESQELTFKVMTAVPKYEGALALLINDGKLRMSGRPVSSDICSWLSVITRIDGRAGVIAEPEDPNLDKRRRNVEEKGRLDVTGFSFNKAGALNCGISGVFKSSRFSLTQASGTNYLLTDMDLQAIAPLKAEIDGSFKNTAIRMRAAEIQYSHEKEIPSVGGLDLVVKLDLLGESAGGLKSVVTAYDFLNAPPRMDYFITQLYNAATLIKGKASFDLPVLRIYAPGVVPSEAVANFSRVGLSTITGVTSGEIALDQGEINLKSEVKLVGVANIVLKTHAFFVAYKPEIFKAMTAGIDLGWHAVPDVRLMSSTLNIQDTGFDKAVEDLTGVPSARYADELLSEILAKSDEVYRGIGLTALGGLTRFLREVPDGQAYEVSFKPKELANITQLILMGVKDLGELIQFGDLNYKVNNATPQ